MAADKIQSELELLRTQVRNLEAENRDIFAKANIDRGIQQADWDALDRPDTAGMYLVTNTTVSQRHPRGHCVSFSDGAGTKYFIAYGDTPRQVQGMSTGLTRLQARGLVSIVAI